MSTLFQGSADEVSTATHPNHTQVNLANQNHAGQTATEYGAIAVDQLPHNGANQISTEYGTITLGLHQTTLERHIAEAKVQLTIVRDQLRTLVKANKDLIAGNVTSYVSTGSISIGGVLAAVIESRLDFGARLGRLQFHGSLAGTSVGINVYNGGAEFFLLPDQLATLGPIDIQVDATLDQCFICWRHNTRILGAFYGTGSGFSVFGTTGHGTFRQIQ